MRIALAGATGLIGHAVAETLAAGGHEIVRIGRGEGNEVRVDLARSSSLPRRALAGCDVLVHAAGVTDEDFADREAAWAKAIFGAGALLAAAREAGVARLACISSAHVYGPLEGRIDESCAANPLSDYAIAHFAGEQLFRRAARDCGASALLVRPCAVFGMPLAFERFARWSLIPFDFPRQALSGRIVLKSTGMQRRNFVSTEGLAYLVGWWLGQPAHGTTVANAPGPSEMSVFDFAGLCARIANEETGRDCRVERPAPQAEAPNPFEYRTRVGGHLPGTTLEDHVRGLVRALSRKAHS